MLFYKTTFPILAITVAGCVGPVMDSNVELPAPVNPTPTLAFGPNPTTFEYTEPAASGLTAVRPYPNPDDVCQVIKKNAELPLTVGAGSNLIACPKHERGAIADRLREGATIRGHARHWTVLST